MDNKLSSSLSEDKILGLCLTKPDESIFILSEHGIEPEVFYQTQSQSLFRVILDMYCKQKVIGILEIEEWCKENKRKSLHEYMMRCIDVSPILIENLQPEIRTVKAYWMRRNMKLQSTILSENSEDMMEEPEELIGQNVIALSELTATHERLTVDMIKKMILGRYRKASSGECSGVATPWHEVNKKLGGLVNGQVTVFAGRGGIGKSQASATLAHFLGSKNIPVGYLPFEDGVERTWSRLAGIDGKYSTFKLDLGSPQTEIDTAEVHLNKVTSYPIFMEDRPMSAEQVMAWAIHQKVKNDMQVLIVDAFKDLRRKTRDTSEDDHMSQILTQTARRLNIPLWVSHHVRKKDGMDDRSKKLTADDIRGSANIVNDARQLIVAQNFKDDMGNECFSFDGLKNNNGPSGWSVMMDRQASINTWAELTERGTREVIND